MPDQRCRPVTTLLRFPDINKWRICPGGSIRDDGNRGSSTSGSLSGVVDINDWDRQHPAECFQITGTSFTVDPNYGRITIPLRVNNVTKNFAGYTAYYNSQSGPVEFVELIELDTNTIATRHRLPAIVLGRAARQLCAEPSAGASGPKNGAVEQDVVGQVTLPAPLHLTAFFISIIMPSRLLLRIPR